MRFKLKEEVKFEVSLAPATRTSDANGASVDRLGYEGPVTFMAQLGVAGDTLSASVKIEAEVQHCDDNSTWVAAADADIETAVTGTNTGTFASVQASGNANQTYTGRYIGSKRYVRCVMNLTGTHTNGTPSAVLAAKEQPRHAPAA
jgi:hypothetical protein